VSLNDLEIRKLAAKTAPDSVISVLDFYGKAYGSGAGYGATEFESVSAAIPNRQYTSNLIYASETNSLAIFCDYSAQYSVNGGSWVDKSILGSVQAGQTIAVRVTTPNLEQTDCSVQVRIGTVTKTYSVVTDTSTETMLLLIATGSVSFATNGSGYVNGVSGYAYLKLIGAVPVGAKDAGLLVPDAAGTYSISVVAPADGTTTMNGEYGRYISASKAFRIKHLASENPFSGYTIGDTIYAEYCSSSSDIASSTRTVSQNIMGVKLTSVLIVSDPYKYNNNYSLTARYTLRK
jgi:hypothetical protein